jgi:hypothetical protein
MRGRHRLVGLLLGVLAASLLMVVGMALAALPPGGTFTDDNGNVHEGNIEAIAAEGITRGCNPPANTLYCPDGTVTRGQMAAFVRRAFSLPSSSADYFADDNDSVFEGDINAVAMAGITKGCNPPDNDRFCPDGKVTREQMAAFLKRAFGYPASATDYFTDDSASIFQNDINAIARAGVTLGCNPPINDRYCPTDLVKRDQMASFFSRALGLSPIVPPPPTVTTTTRPPVAGSASWFCDFGIYSDIFCYGDTDQRTSAEESWACNEGTTWACAGEIDQSNPLLDGWGCYATLGGGYICQGDIDNRDSSDELWACVLGTGGWYCSGDIDGRDAVQETWSCDVTSSATGWFCSGNIDKALPGTESFYCEITGPIGRAWECSGSSTWLAPVVAHPEYLMSWTLGTQASLSGVLDGVQLEYSVKGTSKP